jgi:hypothetical protein
MTTLSWPQAATWRLTQHGLLERAPEGQLLPLVSRIVALHAQVLSSAELAAWQRVEGLEPGDVREAVWRDRMLVKTWAMRGTLHLVAAADLPLVAAAARTRTNWRSAAVLKYHGLTLAEMEAIVEGTRDALDGQCLTREELADAVAAKTGRPELREKMRSGWGSLLKPAAYHGYLCFGPNRGTNVTFVRPDQWIDGWREVIDEDEALREVCRRFLRTYGPARPSDFCEWFASAAFKVADARMLFDGLAAELTEVSVEGRRSFVLAGDESFDPPAGAVRLLPEYDVYVMGFRERDRLVPAAVRALIAQHGRGRYEGPAGVRLVLVDGIAAGLWKRRRRGGRIELRVTLAGRVGRAARTELELEAARIGTFLGLEPELAVESG